MSLNRSVRSICDDARVGSHTLMFSFQDVHRGRCNKCFVVIRGSSRLTTVLHVRECVFMSVWVHVRKPGTHKGDLAEDKMNLEEVNSHSLIPAQMFL